MNQKKGFTLIELLIVIGIIGLIAGAILVAVDPVKRIQDARNAKRWSEVNGILNAILTKQVDDKAPYLGVTGARIVADDDLAQVIVRKAPAALVCAGAGAPTCEGLPAGITLSAAGVACVAQMDASATLTENLSPDYIAELPLDPTTYKHDDAVHPTGIDIGDDNTGYYIHEFESGRIEIGSCWPDQLASIKVKR